jgi:hypothetical protein
VPNLCSKCRVYPRQLIADRVAKSTIIKIYDSYPQSIYPYYETETCYFCEKQLTNRFSLADEFFHRGNLVNSHNDGQNKPKETSSGLY